jgi:diguanylate cyclase (GGDEF)-like protein/PAS domain S-box-containing protein
LRLTIGLILLTISILLVGDLLGLTPDPKRAELSARKAIAEALAVQVSLDVSESRWDAVAETIKTLQQRNAAVLSVGLRATGGRLLASAGDHVAAWVPADGDKSTADHVQVPIHGKEGRWGTLEVSFEPLGGFFYGLFTGGSFAAVILFIAVAGFAAYWLFLKRALNELDPSAVVPDRVRAALNVLAEGLVILDRAERIVLVNAAFERKLGQSAESLVGRKLSALEWLPADQEKREEGGKLPWLALLENGEVPEGTALKLRAPVKEVFTFAVNVAPIKAQDGAVRGAVVTFDDVTVLERKNLDLERALGRLQESQREITRQNRELQVLATRDPLTGALNRRSLFEGLGTLLRESAQEGQPLSCIMVDIDHFKSINDRFGHATGDKVIKLLARILTDTVRAEDLVGRYGGEEFCVILPGVDEVEAAEIAERMRVAVRDGKGAKFTSAIHITSSFGVSCTRDGMLTPGDLVDRADKALYVAKESGRNRVERWSEQPAANTHDGGKPPAKLTMVPEALAAEPVAKPTSRDIPDSVMDEDGDALRARIADLEAVIRELNEARIAGDDANSLPSRVVLYDRIKQAIERTHRFGTRLAVLSIDVDTVQVVDNTLGHAAAEKLVTMTAARLRRILRSTDTVAAQGVEDVGVSVSRLGRGEFGILLTDMNDADSVTWIVQRMLSTLAEPIELEGNDVFLAVSIGVSVYPSDGEDPEALLTNAGAALREAKTAPGRDVCMFYSADMNRRSKEQLNLESHLHRAVERGDLYLEYQPSVDVRTGQIVGLEALLRWRHPEWGLVSPELFVPIAEHTGLIDEIGLWVLTTACRQLKLWHDAGHEQLVMSVNFSAVQLRKRDLAERVIATVKNEGLAPESVVAELTESALIQNLETAVELVDQLHQGGLRVALDDFGTGYSSLGYLKRFPIDVVKVDRSFLRDFPSHAHDLTIVSAIIAMAHSLGLRVVTEGVETEEQLCILQNLECDEIQGYLFSRPIPREQMTALLARPTEIRRMVRNTSMKGAGGPRIAESPVAGVLNEPPVRSVAL